MSNALTWHDRSSGLRKVVGRESPRAPLAEEPDAGNPLVRIWRGAELGNRSAYSTSHFSREPIRQQLVSAGGSRAGHPPRVTPSAHRAAGAGLVHWGGKCLERLSWDGCHALAHAEALQC
jgi:hypothetical protein